ncbi:MAG: flagellar motor switch protein FliN [bacterium]|nr:flagellar motor switch protein FliN [bacterium]
MKTLKSIEDIWLSAMKASVTTLSALVGKNISISNIERRSVEKIGIEILGKSCVVVSSEIKEVTKIFFLIEDKDALAIATFMMGEEDMITEFNEISLSAISEAFSQMISAMALSLSEIIGKKIQIETPQIFPLDDNIRGMIFRDEYIGFKYRLSLDNIETNLYQIVEEESEGKFKSVLSSENTGNKKEISESKAVMVEDTDTTVQPVTFQPLSPPKEKEEKIGNLDLLKDVPIQVSVELGRTKILIKDLLALSSGSIIELDKLAGEPVDILVNGKLIAKGEVVVIDENFGVRITEIISPEKRLEEE